MSMITVQKMRLYGLGIAFACFAWVGATAQTPYGWRGPERSGTYPETGLLKEWPAGGPELLWETMDAGKGYSSPVIVGDRLYLTGMNEDETQEIFSAYTLDGKKVYEVAYSAPWGDTYPETRTTPAIDGDKAYVISGSGEIVCLDIKDGKIATWSQTQWVIEDAPAKAIEAYNKAYEMDPKTADKVKEGLKQISDFCSQVGNTGIDTGNYADAADAYALAFEAQSSPAHGNPEPALLYYAGYLRTVDGAANPASYVIGADYLNKALDLGYNDEEGNIYYYLFHCYYGQKDADKANVLKAKDALVAGIKKFPKNERILDGLVQLYTNPEDSVGDPADLVALIDAAIESNPENVDLWFGRGRIFFALKQYDESIASFQKVVELKPELFEGNYYLGVFYTIKADEMNKVMNEKQYSSQAAYDADLKAANAVYMEAIPWFEKAHELKADDFNTLDMLKQLCFRLRDEPGIQEKYDKYFPLWKAAKGE